MPTMETLYEAVDRLTRQGFTAQFRAEKGKLVVTHGGRRFAPEELHVVSTMRFEGYSDPADAVLLIALSSRDEKVKGTYCVPFGYAVPREDAQMLVRLESRFQQEHHSLP
jgi:hypothetical protein